MEGFGYYRHIPWQLKNRFDHIYIFHGSIPTNFGELGGSSIWHKLQPGHGGGFRSDGKKNFYSDRFGLELTFAEKLQQIQPNTLFGLVKYSKAGTALSKEAGPLGYWDPDPNNRDWNNHFNHLKRTIQEAFKPNDFDRDGSVNEFVPAGIIWVQGESDAAHSREAALAYKEKIVKLINGIRQVLKDNDLPVVLTTTIDSPINHRLPYLEAVNEGKRAFTQRDSNSTLLDLKNKIKFLEDGLHYTSEGYLVLGEELALAAHSLETR